MILRARELRKHYPVQRAFGAKLWVRALDGVSFDLERGKTLAIVGESGCGKSTLARLLIGLENPTAGAIELDGKEIGACSRTERVQKIQMVFQDPYSSINPRKKAWQIVSEPLAIQSRASAAELRDRAAALMAKVGLGSTFVDRYPHMFSGGQRQRLGIARALMLAPKILVCDEPVSALDVSIQAQVLNLLADLQAELGLSYVFISHDLGVVEHVADDVAVMYLGKIVESGSKDQIFSRPQHPYTQALLLSSPHAGTTSYTQFKPMTGELPSPLSPPSGCPLHQRCPYAVEKCPREVPELRGSTGSESRGDAGARVSCHVVE